MTRNIPVMEILAGSVLALVMAASGYATTRSQSAMFDPEASMSVFHGRVEAYAALHRRLAPPPPLSTTDPLAKLLSRAYLASAIRSARRLADQGEIFSPDIA